ncbi:DNA recombination protein RmuC [Hydrotalea sp.]|uniref:DNA recombination protein RmuC n=1 Tax=Hydrotalea sp. TaxID=2881279 RepID=UPI002614C553|nr:DNA recombination protein RmuC [Hydrotalea sp.]
MIILYISVAILGLLLLINMLLTWRIGRHSSGDAFNEIKVILGNILSNVKDTEKNLKDEFVINRKENAETATGLRTEMGLQLNNFTQAFTQQLAHLSKTNEEKLASFQMRIDSNNKESRTELKENLDLFKQELNEALKDYKERLKEQFAAFEKNQQIQNIVHTEKMAELKSSLETSVKTMQEGNEKKLEEMRKTVDEKLNETLEKRLGESFKQVSDRLEAVHKGLGEMQTLAVSVGDLKKVMSNVKSRGVLGEYQLQNIIEDLLTNEQYEKNVKTKTGSGAVVEFAIKMPHGNNLEKTLWLPIDSKFPKEDYEALVDAYDKGDTEKIDEYRKAFINGIKKNAKDIKEKYIDPPNTTEYGIMFLPYESLFGEVLRVPGLFEQLQKDYKITITGPTTLSALLNSLQMGFRTLAIEKRSSEVWDLLGAVKTEFGQFGDVLAKTKKKLIEATNVIDNSEVRTRAIERKLRNVQELPAGASKMILETNEDAIDEVAS